VGQLTGLVELGLTYNRFTELPDELEGCRSLVVLWLNWCLLAEFPLVITRLPRLNILYFDGNPLTTLPPQLANMPELAM
jgi:leucine-rich repeat protein SHOC2